MFLRYSEKHQQFSIRICFYLQNRCLSKRVENQIFTLHQKDQKILEHNQMMKNYEESMKENVAVIEQNLSY